MFRYYPADIRVDGKYISLFGIPQSAAPISAARGSMVT
jgi:hypothetical protein